MSKVSRARLAALLADDDFDIVEANLCMAAEARVDLDPGPYLERVTQIAAHAADAGRGVDGVVLALATAGLMGNRGDYDDPRNSFLDQVLDRGLGLPISLSALTIGVARRLGLPVVGIGMPGHFVVADLSGDHPRYLDPFAAWREIEREECARLVRDTAGVDLVPEHLAPVGPREMLARMLRNLRRSYLARRSLRDALWCAELSLMIHGGDGPAVTDHITLLAGLGRYDEAEASARAYLAAQPDAPEKAAIDRQLTAIADMRRSMN